MFKTPLPLILILATAVSASAADAITAQISYAANLKSGDSYVNLTNAGSVDGTDPAGDICANIYVFAEDQQLISCCSCQLTPNHLQTLSVENDLVANRLTPGMPIGITTLLLPTSGTTCDATAPGPQANGLLAWSTTAHVMTGSTLAMTETRFLDTTLSTTELTKITGLCQWIETAGSGYGICGPCRVGAAGASKQ